jgi:hypothetical protein
MATIDGLLKRVNRRPKGDTVEARLVGKNARFRKTRKPTFVLQGVVPLDHPQASRGSKPGSSSPVPERVPYAPEASPADDRAEAYAEAYDDAVHDVLKALPLDQLVLKADDAADDEDVNAGPYSISCGEEGCDWNSGKHTLLANAMSLHDIHMEAEHWNDNAVPADAVPDDAPAQRKPRRLQLFLSRGSDL